MLGDLSFEVIVIFMAWKMPAALQRFSQFSTFCYPCKCCKFFSFLLSLFFSSPLIKFWSSTVGF